MLKVRAGEHPERCWGGQLPSQFSTVTQLREGPAARAQGAAKEASGGREEWAFSCLGLRTGESVALLLGVSEGGTSKCQGMRC